MQVGLAKTVLCSPVTYFSKQYIVNELLGCCNFVLMIEVRLCIKLSVNCLECICILQAISV